MAKVLYTMEIEEAGLPMMFEAFCTIFNYQSTVTDESGNQVSNPESPADFTRARVIEYLKRITAENEARKAGEGAKQQATQMVEETLIIT